jgi:hypothetical protein
MWMKRFWLVPLLWLVWTGVASAQTATPTSTSTATATPTVTITVTPTPLPPLTCLPSDNLVCPVTNLNPTGPSYGGNAYPSQLYNYANAEQAGRDVEHGWINFVYTGQNGNGCLGTTGAGLTMTPGPCIGYNAGYRAADPNTGTIGFTSSITFSNNTSTWVAMDENTTGNNAAIPNFTRVPGTHYLIDSLDATQPSMGVDTQLLMYVTTSGGSITAVTDLRQTAPGLSIIIPSPLTVPEIITNSLQPEFLNGTDTIGPFNGARSGEKNLGDFGAVASMQHVTCTSVSGTKALSCSGAADFAVGQHVGFFGGGATPSAVATPAVTVIPVTAGSSYQSAPGFGQLAAIQPGCTPFNPRIWGNLGASTVVPSHSYAFEVGNTFTLSGHTYTVTSVGLDSIGITPVLATQQSGRAFFDGVISGTALTSATANFATGDVGRAVSGQNLPTGDTIAAYVSATQVTLTTAGTSGSSLTIGLGVGGQVTGANCTTTRSVVVKFHYPGGAWGPDLTGTTSVAANAENVYNMDDVIVPWDTNADSAAIYGCEGASCNPTTNRSSYTLLGGEVKTQAWNPQTQTGANQWVNDPWMMFGGPTGSGKQAAVDVFFHDVGRAYGSETVYGTALPPAGVTAGYDTDTIASISGSTITLTNNVTTTATAPLYHDNLPALNAWASAALITTDPVGNNYFTGMYMPQGVFPKFGTFSMPPGYGVNIYGITGRGADGNGTHGQGSHAASTIMNMTWGSSGLFLDHDPYAQVQNIMFAADQGSTMGRGVAIDTPLSEPQYITGQGVIANNDIGCSMVGLSLGDINTQNNEFFTIHDNWIGNCANDTGGAYGLLDNDGNSLSHYTYMNHIYGQVGIFTVTGFVVEDTNFPVFAMIGMVTSPFLSTPMNVDHTRQEHLSRWLYSPILGGGFAIQGFVFENNTFQDTQFTPDCGFITFTAKGTSQLDQNIFQSVQTNMGGTFFADQSLCPNGFVFNSDQTSVQSTGNTYETVATPYNNLLGPYFTLNNSSMTETSDNWGSEPIGVIQPIPITGSVTPPTSGTIVSSCSPPFTVSNIQGTEYRASCIIAGLGGELLFPINVSSMNNWSCAKLNVNGNPWAKFRVNFNGGTNTVSLVEDSDVGGDVFRFSDILTNPYTFNAGVSGNSFELLNQTLNALTFTIDMGNWANCQ